MRRPPDRTARDDLDPEKVAYWYFRLNGFLQIENFVIHPGGKGSQRTDADLLAVRFPHRAEFLLDHNEPMQDDVDTIALSDNLIDVVIAEVKTNDPCTLNGPWTREDQQNVHRILAAIGCLREERINDAATDIYRTGLHETDGLRVRLIAVGRECDDELNEMYPAVTQVTWPEILSFIWRRFNNYRHQKTQVDQWDEQGLRLKHLADGNRRDRAAFIDEALQLLGVRLGEDAA